MLKVVYPFLSCRQPPVIVSWNAVNNTEEQINQSVFYFMSVHSKVILDNKIKTTIKIFSKIKHRIAKKTKPRNRFVDTVTKTTITIATTTKAEKPSKQRAIQIPPLF